MANNLQKVLDKRLKSRKPFHKYIIKVNDTSAFEANSYIVDCYAQEYAKVLGVIDNGWIAIKATRGKPNFYNIQSFQAGNTINTGITAKPSG